RAVASRTGAHLVSSRASGGSSPKSANTRHNVRAIQRPGGRGGARDGGPKLGGRVTGGPSAYRGRGQRAHLPGVSSEQRPGGEGRRPRQRRRGGAHSWGAGRTRPG